MSNITGSKRSESHRSNLVLLVSFLILSSFVLAENASNATVIPEMNDSNLTIAEPLADMVEIGDPVEILEPEVINDTNETIEAEPEEPEVVEEPEPVEAVENTGQKLHASSSDEVDKVTTPEPSVPPYVGQAVTDVPEPGSKAKWIVRGLLLLAAAIVGVLFVTSRMQK